MEAPFLLFLRPQLLEEEYLLSAQFLTARARGPRTASPVLRSALRFLPCLLRALRFLPQRGLSPHRSVPLQ